MISAFKDLSPGGRGGGSHVNRYLERNMAGAEAEVGAGCGCGVPGERGQFPLEGSGSAIQRRAPLKDTGQRGGVGGADGRDSMC